MKTINKIIVAIILIGVSALAILSIANQSHYKQRPQKITCVNNLKQIGIGFRVWANDNDGAFPFNVSTNSGGVRELCESDREGFAKDSTAIFKTMHVELGESPRVLVCPQGHKEAADSFESLTFKNITYRVHLGTNVSEANPDEVLVYCPIHGYSLLCNGSVVDKNKKELK